MKGHSPSQTSKTTHEFSTSSKNNKKAHSHFTRKQKASLPLGRDPLAGPPPPATQKRGPSNFSRKKRGLPLSEFLTISSTSSKHGRELLTVKNNGFQTSILDQRSLVRSRGLRKEMRSPLRDPLKQQESSLLVILVREESFFLESSFTLWQVFILTSRRLKRARS